MKILTMLKLIAKGSVVFKTLMLMVLICPFIALLSSNITLTHITRLWGLAMIILLNLQLVISAISIAGSNKANIIPSFKRVWLITLFSWFLFTSFYFYIVAWLSESPNRYDIDYVWELLTNTLSIQIIILALFLKINYKAIFITISGSILALYLMFKIDYMPLWLEALAYNLPAVVKVMTLVSVLALLHWAFLASNRPKLFSQIINQIQRRFLQVNQSGLTNGTELFIVNSNYSLIQRFFYWFTVSIILLYISDLLNSNSLELKHIGLLAILELMALVSFKSNSLYPLRMLWLKGVGDSNALFSFWEKSKIKELAINNLILIAINLLIISWNQITTGSAIILIGSTIILSISTLYTLAFASTLYIQITETLLTLLCMLFLVVIAFYLYPEKFSTAVLILIGSIMMLATLIIRFKLKARLSLLNWSQVLKPRVYGF